MPGKYYDEWTVGERITHQPSRTVTETDNLMFSAMTHNMQPLHLDDQSARRGSAVFPADRADEKAAQRLTRRSCA